MIANPYSVQLRAKLDEYRGRIADRRLVTPSDPAAEVFTFITRDLGELLDRLDEGHALLSPEEYAALAHVNVTPQAVRQWCRAHQLPGAYQTERGWQIPADAVRVRPARRRRSAPAVAIVTAATGDAEA